MKTVLNTNRCYVGILLSNNNLSAENKSDNYHGSVYTNNSVKKGKWYWEVTINETNLLFSNFGVGCENSTTNQARPGIETDGCCILFDGRVYNNITLVTTVTPFKKNDVVGFALDCENRTLAVYNNGIYVITLDMKTYNSMFENKPPFYPSYSSYNYRNPNEKVTFNFGYSNFIYSVPNGYLPYCQSEMNGFTTYII